MAYTIVKTPIVYYGGKNIGKGTWHDNKISYSRLRDMNFTIPIDFETAGVSCSGGCTD